jgi:type II secretion system protein I
MRRRAGITLTEVLLGLAIFVGALAVLSKLIHIGVRASEFAQLHTRAVLLAESKMGELTAGIVPISSSGAVFLEDPAWQWQLSVSDGPVAGLKWVSIEVHPAPGGELANNREPVEFTLSRWMMDPEYFTELDQSSGSVSE